VGVDWSELLLVHILKSCDLQHILQHMLIQCALIGKP
jgi:hypothetical protein